MRHLHMSIRAVITLMEAHLLMEAPQMLRSCDLYARRSLRPGRDAYLSQYKLLQSSCLTSDLERCLRSA